VAHIVSQNLNSSDVQYLPRKAAAAFIKARIGSCTELTLAKRAVTGDGPAFHRCLNRTIYAVPDLIAWADSQIGPKQTSTSDGPSDKTGKPGRGRPRNPAPDAGAIGATP
jgi:hypothetical protein